jgi:hypothetical protein
MNCHECQTWLSDALDGTPVAPARAEAEQHLAACPVCQSFERSLLLIEPHLKRQAARPRLAEDFVSTIMRRLPADPKRLTPEEIARRRAQFDSEHREALALLRPRFWPWQLAAAWPRLGLICAVAVGAWFVFARAEPLLLRLASAWPGLDSVNVTLAMAVAVAVAAVIWDWKLRGSRSRWPRAILTLLRPLRV